MEKTNNNNEEYYINKFAESEREKAIKFENEETNVESESKSSSQFKNKTDGNLNKQAGSKSGKRHNLSQIKGLNQEKSFTNKKIKRGGEEH